jgi:hypothetical protein
LLSTKSFSLTLLPSPTGRGTREPFSLREKGDDEGNTPFI